MQHPIRALLLVSVALPLAAGCSSTGKAQRVSQAPEPPPAIMPAPPVATSPTGLSPIPGHPPIAVSGVVATMDPATGVLSLKDGRTVKLTNQSKMVQPADARALRPGDPVIVRNVLPIGVPSSSTGPGTGKHQRMGTVASVDQGSQIVRLTDGRSLLVAPSTNMHFGTGGVAVDLTDVRPGDQIVFVVVDDPSLISGSPGGMGSPSALPRQGVSAPAPTVPIQPDELMVFGREGP